jgi:hypothetical protein
MTRPVLTLGADPELPLFDEKERPVPAWLFTTGTKREHEKMKSTVGGIILDVHADGVALEFGMLPAHCKDFKSTVQVIYNRLVSTLKTHKLHTQLVSHVEGWDAETLKHPLCLESGCDPDYCAYNTNPEQQRERVFDPTSTTFKYFGGHIHIGYNRELIPPWALVRCIEALVYINSIEDDQQFGRRKVYGLAGIYRPKEYGVEYRTPSNFWLQGGNGFLDCFQYNLAKLISDLETSGRAVNKWFNSQPWDDIKEAINTENAKDGLKLAEECRMSYASYVENGMYSPENWR